MGRKYRSTEDDNKTTRLDIRMHPKLKEALDKYCEAHLESITEAVTTAVKRYIGFDKKVTQD